MSDFKFVVTKKEDLKSLIYQWLDEHPKLSNTNKVKSSNEEKPINRKELAEYLSVSTMTVTEWMKKGLPYRRMHGRVFFMKSEVMASMNAFNHRKNPFIIH